MNHAISQSNSTSGGGAPTMDDIQVDNIINFIQDIPFHDICNVWCVCAAYT